MNSEYYTEEFRHFKYLKLSPELLARYKNTRLYRNRVQRWHGEYAADFEWPHAVEFPEQVFDLIEDNLYIVIAGPLNNKNRYEDANLFVVEKPIILNSNPIIYDNFRRAELEDVPYIEDCLNIDYCLVNGDAFYSGGKFKADARVIRLNTLPIAPKLSTDFTAMFYDKDTAEDYRKTLTEMLRHTTDAVSGFVARF